MSKYKTLDKVLVEAMVITEYNKCGYHVRIINDSRPYVDTDVENVYPLSDHPDKTYEDGLNEAWKAAKIINVGDGGFKIDELYQIFGTESANRIMEDNTPQEALAKIQGWEDRKEIHVGDVVTDYEDNPAVVIRKYYDNRTCMVMYGDFSTEEKEIEALSKTGKTIDLSSLLAMVGGETNGKDKD